MTDVIEPLIDAPFGIFGFSLGGMLAFELCHSLQQRKLAMPTRLGIGAWPAPNAWKPPPPLHTLGLAEMVTGLRELNVVSDAMEQKFRKLLAKSETPAELIETLRADTQLFCTYPNVAKPALGIPIAVIGACDDAFVGPSGLRDWVKQTELGFELEIVAGDHMFIHSNQHAVLDWVERAFRIRGSR